MSPLTHENPRTRVSPVKPAAKPTPTRPFQGFASPTSNTTYTPNQFFDVCLPHASRGAVRLVAYMIRKTLGWCDAQGNPQEEEILVSYQDLVRHAGISRQMIRGALDEAIAGHFIRCVRPGRSKAKGDGGETALYELCWDPGSEYIKDPKRFRGFFEGEGHRTDIPNEFFDRLIPTEPLTVIKVVGAVIRLSIGFRARRGTRRQHVRLSYTHIQRYTRARSRAALAAAVQTALRRNYITRLEEGVFDPRAGRLSRAAVYALRWADAFGTGRIGQKSEPAEIREIGAAYRAEKRTGNGQKNRPEDRSEKKTGIEMKQRNETFKQQRPADAESHQVLEFLRQQGFDSKTAKLLALRASKEQVEDQIRWLPLRRPERNPLGMLRRAIEENWPEPTANLLDLEAPGAVFASHFYAALAGNEGEPVAEPSSHDAGLADRYLERLKEVETGELDPAQWGRAFGQFTRSDLAASLKGRVTLAYALRLHGDGFYLRRKAALHAGHIKSQRADKEAHHRRFHPIWLDYLKAEEDRLQKEDPAAYAHFEMKREEERQLIGESPWQLAREERLARFDLDEERLVHFHAFFSDQVLGFWTWDERLNPHPIKSLTPAA